MRKPQINFSCPAKLTQLSKEGGEESRFSRGKLEVFYKGTTPDGRYFSDDFSNHVIKTLPYAPVVSHYDEENEDFVGHAAEQQILGIVDPCVEPTFNEGEDGNTWAVCDVVLYTERPDTVGKLAEKVIGHSQSLELNPSTVKYVINYDEKKHFKNIEFTAGDIIGVSVLGENQKPAFTGSHFFEYNEEFEAKMKLLREYCEGTSESQNGGEKMDLNEFMKLSWGDISEKVGQAISKSYENDAFTYIVDMFSDSAIVRFYYYVEGGAKLMRVKYICNENGEVELGDVNEVHMTYEDVVESTPVVENHTDTADTPVPETNIEQAQTADAGAVNAEGNCSSEPAPEEEDKKKKDENTPEPENASCGDDDENKKKENCEETFTNNDNQPAQDENVAVTTPEESECNNEESNKQENTSDAVFAESQRAELEALKRDKKIALVNSYKDSLSEEVIEDFMSRIDSFTEDKDLELELLKAYKANVKEIKPMRAFALPETNVKQENSFDAWVRQNLHK